VNLLRRDEDYTPPAQPKVKAFTGTGYKLSGDGDGGASTSAAGAATGPPMDVTPGSVVWEGADASLPTTSIQLRLADGSRLRAEFNLSQTVGDIRRCAAAAAAAAVAACLSITLAAVPPPEAQAIVLHAPCAQLQTIAHTKLLNLPACLPCLPACLPAPFPQVHPRLPARHRGARLPPGHRLPPAAAGRRRGHH
jgi:hypothetical protein